MSDLDKPLGVTGEDVNASVLTLSPLVAIEMKKLLTYPDHQVVPWYAKGYLTGPAYNQLAHQLKETAEGLSAVLDAVKKDPNGESSRYYHRTILLSIVENMGIEQQGSTVEVTWPDRREVAISEYEYCNFSLILPGAFLFTTCSIGTKWTSRRRLGNGLAVSK
ncbi:hypothetical protein [Massilia sp. Root351]|uniref:hypothetical protein n=1 Tax=Massilia sp. Root351 TaxID=1736522 RepID=UPI0012F6FA6D|nr:hypothetical protein [Massilia sp. Root351]